MRTIGDDFGQRRPRQQAALWPGMHLSRRVVIGVEQVVVLVTEAPIARVERLENEAFEKPRDVCEVPLGRADVGHGLHDGVLGLERVAEIE